MAHRLRATALGLGAWAALTPPAAGPAGGSPEGAPSFDFLWLGHDADGYGDDGGPPDGVTDLHFRLVLRGSAPVEVAAVEIRLAGTDWLWSTAPPEPWMVAVAADGRRLGAEAIPVAPGEALDLYAGDNGVLDTGREVAVTVRLATGRPLRRLVTLEPPPGRLLGAWNVHCDPRSAEAFEPMTLSGRLWLVLGDGDSVSGAVGGIPVRGVVEGDSLRAEGRSDDGLAALRGAVTPARNRADRPRAAGSLEVEPAGESCSGGLWWTD